MEEFTILLEVNETKIVHLKMQNQNLSSKRRGAAEELEVENAKFKGRVAELTGKVKGFNS